MVRRSDDAFSPDRRPRWAAWAACIAALGLLVLTWPFLRSPPLDLGASYAHLLGAWAALVIALAALARALADDGRPGGDRA